MYCGYCGKVIPDDAHRCAYCGKRVAVIRRPLIRPRSGRKVAGVAAAFADSFSLDVTLVRVLWLLAVLFTIPVAMIAYIVVWIVIPEEPKMPAMAPSAESAGRSQI